MHLPANGSELVLLDVNRDARLGPLLRSASSRVLTGVLPAPPRRFRTTIVTHAAPGSSEIVERVIEAGAGTDREHGLELSYPPSVFSLSMARCRFRRAMACTASTRIRATISASNWARPRRGGRSAR